MKDTKQTLKDILSACYGSLKTTAELLFTERFFRPFDAIHDDIFDALESGKQKILVIAPRGIGKTSITNFLLPAYKILFQEFNFMLTVSASTSSAELQAENLKNTLVTHPMIETLFGDIKTDSFARDRWVVDVAGHEMCIMPRGAGQQVRGLLYKNSRPDLILIDDLENSESVRSEEQRKKLKEWFFGDLMGVVDRGDPRWRIIYVGTVLHEDALLVNLMEDPSWYVVRLELCDDDFKSNAPNYMSDKVIKELADDYRIQGKIDTFYREYRSLVISTEDAAFQQQFFKYYDEKELNPIFNSNRVETFVVIDPARTAKLNSADSAIVGVSVDLFNRSVYVRDVVSGKFHPEELYNHVKNMILQLNARLYCIEITGLHEFITYPLQNFLKTANVQVELLELTARGGVNEKGKVERVRSLVPFYRQGLIYHNRSACGGLEAQLLSFPRPKRWDIMDAFGYLPQILDFGNRFMYPEMPDDYDKKDTIEDEYASLDDLDFVPLNKFRTI